jgi:hypothetical protein
LYPAIGKPYLKRKLKRLQNIDLCKERELVKEVIRQEIKIYKNLSDFHQMISHYQGSFEWITMPGWLRPKRATRKLEELLLMQQDASLLAEYIFQNAQSQGIRGNSGFWEHLKPLEP